MKIHKLTLVLIVLVLGTLGFTYTTQTQTSGGKANDTQALKKLQEKNETFPIADYDEAELTDPQKNQIRKEKKLRHNNFRMVARNPPEWQAELLVINEGNLNFPAIPVIESTLILRGSVRAAEAHVSENKKNVYSEFRVSITKVFKTASSSIVEGSEITVDRVGGFVRYPNGRTVLYRFSNQNMPAIGGDYLFFLTSPNNQDLKILTAYQLGPSGVIPLDDSDQFERFRGVSEEGFIQNLKESLTKFSPY
jgi:hypothetical protein